MAFSSLVLAFLSVFYHVAVSEAAKSPCSMTLDGKLPAFTPGDFSFSGNVRRYYLAAQEEEWDYVPSGYDNVRGVPLGQSNVGKMYVGSSTSLGTKYIKGLFRGYTDATYKTRSTQPDWLGFQGPVMRAEVGDMIEVLLYNNFSDDSVSMHSMGLFYNKVSEGSDYFNITAPSGKASFSQSEAIPPGGCYAYKWLVPQSSSPLSTQPSKLWSYHGDINLEQDVDTGLFGPVIVYQQGQMQQTLSKYREFVLFYASTTESDSVFFAKSVMRFLPSKYKPPGPESTPSAKANESVWGPIFEDEPDTAIKASAQAPTHLNGYLYSNLPGLEMCLADNVIWYLYSFGVFSDGFHVFHPHGNNIQVPSGEYMAQVPLLPSSMSAVTMTTFNPGIWDVICHNGDHYEQGMVANYRVYNKGACPKSVSEQLNIVM